MIDVAWIFPICVFVAGIGWLWNEWRHKKAGENATSVFWANRKLPLIYEQQDIGTGDVTREQYEEAKRLLRHYGNKYDPPVHLWVYVADGENAKIGFSLWQLENVQRRTEIYTPFLLAKNRQAAAAGKESQAAEMWHGEN